MIKSLSIQNMQSHKDSTLEFVPGMNVIVGQSDSGKTAIIRAFNWVKDNRPSGDAHRSNWGGDTSVKITTIEGLEITREKTNKTNAYKLSSIKEPFLAFGQEVPIEIQRALKMDDINVQKQLDAPFLLSETSGYISAHFNKIARLEKIDKSRNYIQSEINSLNTSIKADQKIIKEKTELLETFVDLDALEKDLKRIEVQEVQLKQIYSNIEIIKNLNLAYENLSFEITEKETIIEAEKGIEKILSYYEKKNEVVRNFNNLKKLGLKIFDLQNEIIDAENIVLAETDVNKILNYYATLQQTSQKAVNLQKLCNYIEAKENSREKLSKQLSAIEKEFHDNFPDICPLCDTHLKKK